MAEEEETKKMYVHATKDFCVLQKSFENASIVDSVYVYNMPDKVENYLDQNQDLVRLLSDYEVDEKWRITEHKTVNCSYNSESNEITLKLPKEIKILDARTIYILPDCLSFIVIPGELTEASGGVLPNQIFRLRGLLAKKILLLDMETEVAEDGSVKPVLQYKEIQPNKQEDSAK